MKAMTPKSLFHVCLMVSAIAPSLVSPGINMGKYEGFCKGTKRTKECQRTLSLCYHRGYLKGNQLWKAFYYLNKGDFRPLKRKLIPEIERYRKQVTSSQLSDELIMSYEIGFGRKFLMIAGLPVMLISVLGNVITLMGFRRQAARAGRSSTNNRNEAGPYKHQIGIVIADTLSISTGYLAMCVQFILDQSLFDLDASCAAFKWTATLIHLIIYGLPLNQILLLTTVVWDRIQALVWPTKYRLAHHGRRVLLTNAFAYSVSFGIAAGMLIWTSKFGRRYREDHWSLHWVDDNVERDLVRRSIQTWKMYHLCHLLVTDVFYSNPYTYDHFNPVSKSYCFGNYWCIRKTLPYCPGIFTHVINGTVIHIYSMIQLLFSFVLLVSGIVFVWKFRDYHRGKSTVGDDGKDESFSSRLRALLCRRPFKIRSTAASNPTNSNANRSTIGPSSSSGVGTGSKRKNASKESPGSGLSAFARRKEAQQKQLERHSRTVSLVILIEIGLTLVGALSMILNLNRSLLFSKEFGIRIKTVTYVLQFVFVGLSLAGNFMFFYFLSPKFREEVKAMFNIFDEKRPEETSVEKIRSRRS